MIPNRPRSQTGPALAIALLVLGLAAGRSVDENLARLREMSPQRRRELAENLRKFEELPRVEKARVRELDRQLAEAEPQIQERYYEVLRRYDLWRNSLDPESRRKLDATAPDQRITVVRELLENQPDVPGVRIDAVLARYSSLHSLPLLDEVYQLRSWFALTADQKREVLKLPDDRQGELLERYGRRNGVTDDRANLRRRFQREVNERLRDRPGRGLLLETMKPQAREALTRRLVDARFLQDYEPAPVAPANLDRFIAGVPSRVLDSLVSLPPQAARLRLQLLYRLVFPAPEEVPSETSETVAPTDTGAPAPQPVEQPPVAPLNATPF